MDGSGLVQFLANSGNRGPDHRFSPTTVQFQFIKGPNPELGHRNSPIKIILAETTARSKGGISVGSTERAAFLLESLANMGGNCSLHDSTNCGLAMGPNKLDAP
jgi:hypothetical protein